MSMHKGMTGKIGPASADLTLADYIQRKTRDDAFNAVKADQLKQVVKMFQDSVHNAWPDRLQLVIDTRGNGVVRGWGCELVLRPDGQWFYNDTSGG